MRVPRFILIGSLLLAAAAACAPSQPRSHASTLRPRTGPLVRPSTVRVTNHNWSTITVYAARGGQRVRLGTVSTMQSAVFRLTGSMGQPGSDLRLIADLIGSPRSYISPTVQMWGGQQADFVVENALSTSHVSVWNR